MYIPVDVSGALVRELRRRKYSEKTIETYLRCVQSFLRWVGKPINRISKADIQRYLESLSALAGSTINVHHMAIRFLFEEVLRKRIWVDIRYSKIPKRLPRVLSQEEVSLLFSHVKNQKHLLMLQLMYGAGLRVSELIGLRKKDFFLDKGYGFVRGGKGNKDRLFVVPAVLNGTLGEILNGLREDNTSVFSGRDGEYSSRTIQQIVKAAAKEAGLKGVHPHTLRHSFATHLIERGEDLLSVQALLGHASPETTMTYVHLAGPRMLNVQSPLDSLPERKYE